MSKDLRRIVTIGPAYPFRGGIAHYTSLLLKELSISYEVTCVSYKRMYPKFLYPGKIQTDDSNDFLRHEDTRFLIDTINPFTYFSAASAIRRMSPDLIVFHWWHPFFAPAYIAMLSRLRKDHKIIICCNNVLPHDRFPLARFLTKQVLSRADGYLVHSIGEEKELLSLRNPALFERNVCPVIDVSPPTDLSKSDARLAIGIPGDAEVLLFFGFVRSYKGLRYLLEALPAICASRPHAHLLIVGDFYEDKEIYQRIIRECNLENRITIVDSYVPDKEIAKYFIASDLTVLPYESATTSGVIPISYRYRVPVVATRVGGLPEAVEDGVTGYLVEPCQVEPLAQAVIKYFDKDDYERFVRGIDAMYDRYSWRRIVEKIEKIWDRINSNEK